MEAVAENAARVCGALDSAIFRLEGEHLRLVARHGPLRNIIDDRRVRPGSVATGSVDGLCSTGGRSKSRISGRPRRSSRKLRRAPGRPGPRSDHGWGHLYYARASPLGVLFVNRGPEPTPFSAKQIALLETFANQAVIAIENVRLFTELQEKNRALTEAHAQVTESLEQQTATSEILRIIASSPTDLQPVLDAVVASAARVCGADDVVLARIDADTLRPVAGVGRRPETDVAGGATRVTWLGRWPCGAGAPDGRTSTISPPSQIPSTRWPRLVRGSSASEPCLPPPLLREGQRDRGVRAPSHGGAARSPRRRSSFSRRSPIRP